MTLPKYGFISFPEFRGIEFILQTKTPYSIYRVYKFDCDQDRKNFFLKHDIFGNFINEGFNIAFCHVGTLTNFHLTPMVNTVQIEYQNPELKAWYFEHRIKGNESRLKKFKA